MDLALRTNLEPEGTNPLSTRLPNKVIYPISSSDRLQRSVVLSYTLVAGRFQLFANAWRQGAPGTWNKSRGSTCVCAKILVQVYE